MKKIIYCLTANKKTGLGHLNRGITLAETLSDSASFYFLINNFNYTKNILIKNNYKFIIKQKKYLDIIKEKNIDIAIVDYINCKIDFIKNLRKIGIKKIISFDDLTDSKFFSDILIDSKINEKNKKIFYIRKKIYKSKVKEYFGLDYQIYSKNIIKAKLKTKINNSLQEIFVCFGGTDPNDYTLKIIDIASKFKNINFNIIITTAYKNYKNIKLYAKNINNIKILENINNIEKYMISSDIAIVSGGNLMFESLVLNSVTIVLSQNRAQTSNINLVKNMLFYYNHKFISKDIENILNINNYDKLKTFFYDKKHSLNKDGVYKIKDIILND